MYVYWNIFIKIFFYKSDPSDGFYCSTLSPTFGCTKNESNACLYDMCNAPIGLMTLLAILFCFILFLIFSCCCFFCCCCCCGRWCNKYFPWFAPYHNRYEKCLRKVGPVQCTYGIFIGFWFIAINNKKKNYRDKSIKIR